MRRRSISRSGRHKRPRIVFTEVQEPGSAVASAQPVRTFEGSNFYIIPREVFDFLATHPQFYDGDRLDLTKIRDWFIELESSPQTYDKFWRGDRSSLSFLVNEYHKLHAKQKDTRRADWLFPHLVGVNGSTLIIPSKDVFDLPIYIMFYILRQIGRAMGSPPP